jgi:hypothetical protein
MIIPEKLRIHAQTIDVHNVPVDEIDKDGNGGRAIWEQNIIQLGADMPEDRTAVSFLHEILHFVNTYLEEKECTFISEGLLQVIRDNNLDFRVEDTSGHCESAKALERARIVRIVEHQALSTNEKKLLIDKIKGC